MLGITTIRPRSSLRGAGLCLFPHGENHLLPGSHAAPAARGLSKAEVLCCRRTWAQGLYLFLLSFHDPLSFPTFVFLTLSKNSPYFRLPQSSLANEQRYKSIKSFPGGTSGKEPTCQCRRHMRCGFDTWVGKIPWRRAWQATPLSLPGDSPRTEEPGRLYSIESQGVRHRSETEHTHALVDLCVSGC